MNTVWIESLPSKAHWDWSWWDKFLHGLHFRKEVDYRLVKEHGRATWEIPSWANTPSAGIIGTWRAQRSRLVWFGIPVSMWRKL